MKQHSLIGDRLCGELRSLRQEVLGWSVGELTAGPYLDFVHPDDIAATAEVAGKLADGAVAVNFENRYRCKDGTYRWLNWNAAPVHSREVIYAAARDVTEERRIREQLQDGNLKTIPVVVLTSSREERDLVISYNLGVNAYVVKPVDFHEFIDAVSMLGGFWAVVNEPPPARGGGHG